MKKPKKTSSHTGIQRIGAAMYAIVFGMLATITFRKLDSMAKPGMAFLVFCAFSLVFYFAWAWLFIEHREELESKPPTSKELRKQKREFFANLPK